MFEMDSLTIVTAVQKQNLTRSYWGKVTRRCNTFIKRNPQSTINWIRRAGNQAAHQLANWAFHEPNKTWLHETPLVL
jgi:hypothetical protein